MSSLVVESPVQSGQLFFPWSEDAEHEVAEELVSPIAAQSLDVICREPAIYQPAVYQPPSANRIAEPVRIGSVMIKLLKRYGITDDEIAEGLQSYAKKTCGQAAS